MAAIWLELCSLEKRGVGAPGPDNGTSVPAFPVVLGDSHPALRTKFETRLQLPLVTHPAMSWGGKGEEKRFQDPINPPGQELGW